MKRILAFTALGFVLAAALVLNVGPEAAMMAQPEQVAACTGSGC
jgi:hypothetical protein